jgi:hypothetical protein
LSPPIPAISLYFVLGSDCVSMMPRECYFLKNIHLQCSMNDTSVYYLAL